jgi:hypothetical protein
VNYIYYGHLKYYPCLKYMLTAGIKAATTKKSIKVYVPGLNFK